MSRRYRALAYLISAMAVVAAGRAAASADFLPAHAAEPSPVPSPTIAAAAAVPATDDFLVAVAPSPTAAPSPSAEPALAETPAGAEPTQAPEPVSTPAPTPARPAPTARPVVAAAPTAQPVACAPGAWFCYPRVGISGAIVPYSDCSGSTDIGTQIRSFMCLSDRYLMGHAYTQFGRITQWQAGDIVYAYGRTYTVTGAVVARSCEPPPFPLAPLSMQTSLSANTCGAVLVVQAR